MSLAIVLSLLLTAPSGTVVDCNKSPYWSKKQDCPGAQLQTAESEMADLFRQSLQRAADIDSKNSGDYGSVAKGNDAVSFLKQSQDAWMIFRNKTCHLEYFKDPGELSRDAEGECLLALTKSRIRGLKAFME